MAQVIENKKGFRVIQVTLSECIKWGGLGICDWCERATYYPEDSRVEEKNFNYMKSVLNL